jgi:hypothetical protein
MEIEWRMSEQCGELFESLSKAQAIMKGAIKDSANPFFKSKYADLSAVIEAAKPITEFGLCVTQLPIGNNGLLTILGHKSGQYLCCEMRMVPTKTDPQGIGSVITYMRRYAYQAIVGIPSEDDDGNAACASKFNQKQKDAIISVLIKNNSPELKKYPGTPDKWSEEIWDKAALAARKYKGVEGA